MDSISIKIPNSKTGKRFARKNPELTAKGKKKKYFIVIFNMVSSMHR